MNNPNSTIPTVTVTRSESIELGGNYKVSIQADSLENIASVSTNITYDNAKKVDVVTKYLENNKFYDDYGNELTQGADGNYYDAGGNLVPEPIRPNRTGIIRSPAAFRLWVRTSPAASGTRPPTAIPALSPQPRL